MFYAENDLSYKRLEGLRFGLFSVFVRISLSPPFFFCFFDYTHENTGKAAYFDLLREGLKRVEKGWRVLRMFYGVEQRRLDIRRWVSARKRAGISNPAAKPRPCLAAKHWRGVGR